MSDLKKFGRDLRKVINQDDVFEILEEGDWGAGGCWILAEALVQWLGPPARLVAVSSSKDIVEHVVVQYVDLFIDYMGAQTERELLRNLEKDGIRDPQIEEFGKTAQRAARKSGIPCHAWQVQRLITKLNTYFSR